MTKISFSEEEIAMISPTISHETDWSQFSYSYTCILVFVITFVMVAPKDVSIYNKINSFGVLFICIIIFFTIGVGIYSLMNTYYTMNEAVYEEFLNRQHDHPESKDYLSYIPLYAKSFAPLMGILGGGFYFHNVSLSVCRTARNPQNNVRDVFLGYLATFITYVVCGVAGVYGFTGREFSHNLTKDGLITQNCLDMFPVTDYLATIIRFCAFA